MTKLRLWAARLLCKGTRYHVQKNGRMSEEKKAERAAKKEAPLFEKPRVMKGGVFHE